MSNAQPHTLGPRRQQAVNELIGLIRAHYPDASYAVGPGQDDPWSTYITAMVDLDDPDVVTDLTIERELELQIEVGIPVYVIPIRTPERAAKVLRQMEWLRPSVSPTSSSRGLTHASGHERPGRSVR